jgi:hypothetical protein
VDDIHGFEDGGNIIVICGMKEEVGHLPFNDIEVIEFEDAWSLEDKEFD